MGKRIRESIGTTNRRKAERAEEDRRTQLRRIALGLEKPPKPESLMPEFTDYANEWLDVYAKVNCKTGTCNLDRQIIRDHLNPPFGKKKLDEITRKIILAMVSN